jgi:hypothetical protein
LKNSKKDLKPVDVFKILRKVYNFPRMSIRISRTVWHYYHIEKPKRIWKISVVADNLKSNCEQVESFTLRQALKKIQHILDSYT